MSPPVISITRKRLDLLDELRRDGSLSTNARLVGLEIIQCRREQLNPSVKTIAHHLNISPSTVARTLIELVESGWIDRRSGRQWGHNHYVVPRLDECGTAPSQNNHYGARQSCQIGRTEDTKSCQIGPLEDRQSCQIGPLGLSDCGSQNDQIDSLVTPIRNPSSKRLAAPANKSRFEDPARKTAEADDPWTELQLGIDRIFTETGMPAPDLKHVGIWKALHHDPALCLAVVRAKMGKTTGAIRSLRYFDKAIADQIQPAPKEAERTTPIGASVPTKPFVLEGSPAWRAWLRAKGKSSFPVSPLESDRTKRGFWFPSAWPPGWDEARLARAEAEVMSPA